MRRRRDVPDDRPDWRDPDMPVVRGNKLFSPAEAKRFASITLSKGLYDWRRDPTYNLRRVNAGGSQARPRKP